MCPDCGRSKMQFETKEKAERFIRFNGQDIVNDVSKLRVYFCEGCNCFHISSKKIWNGHKNRLTNLIKAYHKDMEFKQEETKTNYEAIFNNLDENIKMLSKTKFKKWLRENTRYTCNDIGEINKFHNEYIEKSKNT